MAVWRAFIESANSWIYVLVLISHILVLPKTLNCLRTHLLIGLEMHSTNRFSGFTAFHLQKNSKWRISLFKEKRRPRETTGSLGLTRSCSSGILNMHPEAHSSCRMAPKSTTSLLTLWDASTLNEVSKKSSLQTSLTLICGKYRVITKTTKMTYSWYPPKAVMGLATVWSRWIVQATASSMLMQLDLTKNCPLNLLISVSCTGTSLQEP